MHGSGTSRDHRDATTAETERAFVPRAILMGAGLVQLPPMIALLGGSLRQKTPPLHCCCAAMAGGQFFGAAGSAVSISPQFLAQTHHSLSFCLCFV